MFSLRFLYLFLLLLKVITPSDIVSSEKDYIVHKERIGKLDSNAGHADLSNRRFIQDLDDSEWHVAHLKDTEFSRRSECVGDTLEDKVSRYRKALKNDGALVEFVSSDPLPFNASELEETQKCHRPSNYTVFLKKNEPKTNDVRISTLKMEPGNNEEGNIDEKETSFENGTIDEGVRTATTVNSQPPLNSGDKVKNKTESRRVSEYQFSSVEYYDEITQFDEDFCPDDITVINLEIDQLRSYDVECEAILEWHSLE